VAGREQAAGAAVVEGTFSPPADRRSLLDRAHRGDIEGALGRVYSFDTGPRRSARRRLLTMLAIMGPGLVVMAAGNDAGSLSVYAQAGEEHGRRLVWLVLALWPMLFVNQEMVARLGAVTGAGHARLIFERFGRRWGGFALADLLVLNLLTIVTEFIGIGFALGYFGISRSISIPVAALVLIATTSGGRFRRWERVMYALVAVNLLVIPLALLSRSHAGAFAPVTTGPGGAVRGSGLLIVFALAGTTLAPWQLFFQQSNVVDKRITPRWLGYERLDTLVGSAIFCIGAVAVLVTFAAAFAGIPWHAALTDAGQLTAGLRARLGEIAGAVFALVLLNASVLAACVVTLSTSYAVGDVFGFKHSLHRGWRDARVFHGSFAAMVGLAAFAVLLPGVPLGLVSTGVQALTGVLLPSACIFLILLCNDKDVLGPWVNPRWLNALASAVVAFLLMLSALLTVTTVDPAVDVWSATYVLSFAAAAFLLVLAFSTSWRSHANELFEGTPWERVTWTMPRLETLAPMAQSRARSIALIILRLYLATAAAFLVLRLIRLALAP
jgi:Mn2+/Fe2+ NRAMP family transporter